MKAHVNILVFTITWQDAKGLRVAEVAAGSVQEAKRQLQSKTQVNPKYMKHMHDTNPPTSFNPIITII